MLALILQVPGQVPLDLTTFAWRSHLSQSDTVARVESGSLTMDTAPDLLVLQGDTAVVLPNVAYHRGAFAHDRTTADRWPMAAGSGFSSTESASGGEG